MKLCHVIASLEEQYGGPSKSVRSLCQALASAGDHVDLLSTLPEVSGNGEANVTGRLRTAAFQRGWPARFCPSAGLRAAVAACEADVFHHHALWLRTLHYAHRSARACHKPLVLSPRGMMSAWAWRFRSGRKRFARLFVHPGALEAVSGWHATSVDEAEEIRALGFKQPVCVAPNGVNAPVSADVAAAEAHWHATCPATAARPVALFYSRLHRKKRVLELIDLWLERAPAEWLLLVVGIPQDYTPESLEHYVLRASGTGRVAIFSGAERPPPYAIASLFLLPSHNENFGLAIAEAMAHGLPVVVTDTTPWQTVQAEGLGWCVAWEEYGRTLHAAVREPLDRLHERGALAREWVLREYSWQRAADTLREFYRTLQETRS